MSDEQTQPNVNEMVSANAGSTKTEGSVPTQSTGGGQTQENVDPYMKMYKELEVKFGEQGTELGEYRAFMKQVEPLLNKLSEDQELVKMIIDGKVSSEVLKGLEKGTITPQAAEAVTKAHEDVKKDLGKDEYEKSTPEQIEKLVSEKVATEFKKVTEGLTEKEELRDYESYTKEFIKNTPDLSEYSDKIQEWFNEHPEQEDIRIAYEVVKGRVLAEKYKTEEQKATEEAAKEVAANAAGGGSQSSGNPGKVKDVDKYIGGSVNPNFSV